MYSDELIPPTQDPQSLWLGLEKRIHRLLERLSQLRDANAQLMNENAILKNKIKTEVAASGDSAAELQKLQAKYEEALQDLGQARQNLRKIESLVKELKLENPETVSEG